MTKIYKCLSQNTFMLLENEIIFRYLVSVIIGLFIGFSRKHKPAGVRTFALISLGCTIFTVISINNFPGSDPTRIIAQVVSGIGFLGLGVIWKNELNKPYGLTTAAAIWATASVGILIGMGMWLEVVAGSALILVILYAKKPIEKLELPKLKKINVK